MFSGTMVFADWDYLIATNKAGLNNALDKAIDDQQKWYDFTYQYLDGGVYNNAAIATALGTTEAVVLKIHAAFGRLKKAHDVWHGLDAQTPAEDLSSFLHAF